MMQQYVRTILSALLTLGVHVFGSAFGVCDSRSSERILIDGSSTVFPITEAVAEEFRSVRRDVSVTVGVSGTGGGFKKFLAGEVDVVDASRPIKAAELEVARQNNISFIELPVAYDALSVVVNKNNTWTESLTTADLKKIWAPDSQGKVTKWSDIKSGFPDIPLQLFGPGTDSGTFDYFTEVINGKEDASRGDYTSSEDDNVIVTGVAGNEGALGYFGLAFYEANKSRLKVVAVDDQRDDNGQGPQEPNAANVESGQYSPLSRPLFIYVKTTSLEKPALEEFLTFYLDNANSLVAEVGYVPLSQSVTALVKNRLANRIEGTLFSATSGDSLEAMLSNQAK
jgi:phosphate transport system substrate-binding protein